MSEFKPFSAPVVVFKEPTATTIVPKSGPHAGKETGVLEFGVYQPKFEKKDGKFEKTESVFYTVRYFGSEKAVKRIAGNIKEGMMLEVRGDSTVKTFKGKDGQEKSENVINAKGLAVSLNQPGLSLKFERQVKKTTEVER